MKISYSKKINRYVVSEGGKIICTTPDLEDAQRVFGVEPAEEDLPPRPEKKAQGGPEEAWDGLWN